jgi:hypothetical protein
VKSSISKFAAVWLLSAGILLGCVLLSAPDLSAQCAMCRTALTQSEEGQRWARGINAGILLLLAAPFLIAGSAAFVMYRPQLRIAASRMRARWPRRARVWSLPEVGK